MQNRGITEKGKSIMEFRDLRADEIECRIGSISDGKGVSVLLYKNSRVDMAVLDETVGAENWQREHYECKGNLFCKVGVNTNYADETKDDRWIWKSDCGTESNAEREKGESSDSFKRACFNWGIGRELYTAPFIWIKWDNCQFDGKGRPKSNFKVTHMEIKDKKIVALEIINGENKTVYKMGAKGQNESKAGLTPKVRAILSIAQKKGVTEAKLKAKYKVNDLNDLTEEQTQACINGLATMSDKVG